MSLFVKLCNLDFLNIKDLQTLGNSINLASSSAISVPTLFSISGVQHSENLSTEWDLQDLESDISTFRKTGSDWDLQIQNFWCLPLFSSTSSEDLQYERDVRYNLTVAMVTAPLWTTVPDMTSLQKKRKYSNQSLLDKLKKTHNQYEEQEFNYLSN